MEFDTAKPEYTIKGGRTILGRIFAYQEKTGMPPNEILKMPYIQFVLGMLDAPQVDYESKKKTKDKKDINRETMTDEDEIASVMLALG